MATAIARPAIWTAQSLSRGATGRATQLSSRDILQSRHHFATCSVLSPSSKRQRTFSYHPSTSTLHQPSIAQRSTIPIPSRHLSTTSSPEGTIARGASASSPPMPDHLNEAESNIYRKLSASLSPTQLSVQDISGGCGSMYGIEIVSEAFRGLSMLKQQRLVNQVLGEEIRGWHGVQLKTRVP